MLRTKEKNLMKEREIEYCEDIKILESRAGQGLNKDEIWIDLKKWGNQAQSCLGKGTVWRVDRMCETEAGVSVVSSRNSRKVGWS